MRLPYPRSFTAVLLAAFALVMLPLWLGLMLTAYTQQRLAAQTQAAIAAAVQVTRVTRELSGDLAMLQRAAGQYYVLQDAQLRAGMQEAHVAVGRAVAALQGLPLAVDDRARLARIAAGEAELYDQLKQPGSTGLPRFDSFAPRFSALEDLSDRLVMAGNAMVDRQIADLRSQARRLGEALVAQAVGAVLLSVLIAGLFSWWLSRPVRQVHHIIRTLGAGDLQPQPAVQGPADLVQLGAHLDWLRRRLREIDEQKLGFLRHVSHELKTPLASLREGVELLLDEVGGELGPEQREIAQIMRGNTRDLQQRIENLIGYSRAQRRLDPLVPSDVDLGELLRTLVRRNDLALRAKHVGVDIEGTLPALRGDRGKLDTLFENLLINALRFSPPAGRIRLSLERSGPDGGWAVIRCCDQGPGVAEQDREHLFKPFFQGMRQPEAAAPGNGLGLAIAQEYAHLHGGEVRLCTPTGGAGACFCVQLPLVAGQAESPA